MDIGRMIFFIIFSGIAVSYGWGMRGTIIGGEKGAMLPGAFLGLLMAVFSSSEVLASSPWLLAGAGALSMYCGGNMTYAETLHITMQERKPPHFFKNMAGGIFLRGGIWFGIFGGFVSMMISAAAGYYELWQLLAFFGLLPVFAYGCFRILNKPYVPDENKLPKIYFSIKRRETWGGLFGILLEMIIFTAVFRDFASLVFTGGAFLSGAVGWTIGQLLHRAGRLPNKKGKKLFHTANENGYIDSWKIMECVFGAIGGMGTALTFALARPLFSERFAAIDANGLHSYIPESKITYILFILYIVILLADCMQYFIKPYRNRRYNKKLLKMKLITKDAYKKAIEIQPESCEAYVRYKKFCTNSEFAVYSIIPLTLSFLGAHMVLMLAAFPLVLLVLCQEATEKCIKHNKADTFIKLSYLLPAFAVMILIAVAKKPMLLPITMLMYTVFYEVCFFLICKLIEHDEIFLTDSEKTVHGYFSVCCITILIMTFFI